MKVCVIQPFYSFCQEDTEKCFNSMLELIEQCDESLDIIVLPEYCDIPAAQSSGVNFHGSIEKYNSVIFSKCVETAKRCNALVFANFADITPTGPRNTTFCFDRRGNIFGKYYKAHPAPSEVKTFAEGGNEMDCSYSYIYREPYTVEIEGIRFGFMTCYDFYMYESYASLARQNVDIIIGCSHQRTDTHNALDIFGRFLCYNTNAYLLRSSVSLGKDSELCGCSMIVSPKGEMLLNMKNEIGLGIFEIDPHEKYYKPAGFKGIPKAHYEYIDEGRRPWLYRQGGSNTVPSDAFMNYPRICAHRGFSTVAPENSLPAFGSAIALGADEIEFDIWSTKDDELVSLHDSTLDRVSNGSGKVWDYTLEELRQLDFGVNGNEHYKGLKIVTFEEILKKFACTAVMNIHIKIWDRLKRDPFATDPLYEKIAFLLQKYDCEHHCYIMSSNDECLKEFHKIAPEIHRCVGFDGTKDNPLVIVDRAIKMECEKVQLFKPYFDKSTVKYAHENGILCNVFWADDPKEAHDYLDMGIDCILTNDYLKIANELKIH